MPWSTQFPESLPKFVRKFARKVDPHGSVERVSSACGMYGARLRSSMTINMLSQAPIAVTLKRIGLCAGYRALGTQSTGSVSLSKSHKARMVFFLDESGFLRS